MQKLDNQLPGNSFSSSSYYAHITCICLQTGDSCTGWEVGFDDPMGPITILRLYNHMILSYLGSKLFHTGDKVLPLCNTGYKTQYNLVLKNLAFGGKVICVQMLVLPHRTV